MKVLVFGSGGREHSLVKACVASPLVTETVAAPGNGGMAADARCVGVDIDDVQACRALALAEAPALVIIGPEAPLAAGLADNLRAEGLQVYGPSKDGAQLEASKAHAKAFMRRHGIPTANSETFSGLKEAVEYLSQETYPVVLKASGLAAGKGVVIENDFEHAEITARDMLVRNRFGESGREILVEEFLTGEEASIMLMVSGTDYVLLPASQDHKRIGEGDTGPNTGGMGAYAPAAVVTDALRQRVIAKIIEPTLKGLAEEGIDYRGTLYIGIMVEPDGGPKVIEYNVRFGDPECQVLLPLLETDPVALMLACASGDLAGINVRFKNGYAAVIVQVAEGYPAAYRKGDPISLPSSVPEGTAIIHAGTQVDDYGNALTNGGRVTGIVGTGATLKSALESAYALAEQVTWRGCTYRRDIGWRQLQRET